MNVFVMKKARMFEPERFIGVAKSAKSAERELRKLFPHMKEDSHGSYISDSNFTWLLFIEEVPLID